MSRRIGMRTMVAASEYGQPTFTMVRPTVGLSAIKKRFPVASATPSVSFRAVRASPSFSPGLTPPSMTPSGSYRPSGMVPGSARVLGPAPISPAVAANLDRIRQQAAGTPAFRGVLLAELETLLQLAKRRGFRRFAVITRKGRKRDRISLRPYPQPGRRVSRLTMKIAYIRMLLGRTRNQADAQRMVARYFGRPTPAGRAPSFAPPRPPVIPTGLETPTSYTYTTTTAGWGAAMIGPGMI